MLRLTQRLCRQFLCHGVSEKNEQTKGARYSQVFEHTDLESMSNGGLMVGIGQQWILCGRLHLHPSLSAKHTRFWKKKTLSDAFKMISSFCISHSWFFLYPVERLCETGKLKSPFPSPVLPLTCQFTAVQSAGRGREHHHYKWIIL